MVATGRERNNADPPATAGAALERIHDALSTAPLSYGHGTDNPWDEAVELLLCGLGKPATGEPGLLDEQLTAGAWNDVQRLLEKRISERQPLPYLTGRAFFAGLEFHCDRRALVPRSPLAELIENDYAPWWPGASGNSTPRSILDLCCGGGCIGIAAALHAPQARVLLADIDRDALALAAENIRLHACADRVSCAHADLFTGIPAQRFDLILSNPPYVDAADIAAMPAEYRAEPLHALAAGGDGLDLALRILASAHSWLEEGGLLVLEVGNSWEALEALCPQLPLTWVKFEYGGHGVLVAQAAELQDWQPHFAALAAKRTPDGV